jgi:hypothetical protein
MRKLRAVRYNNLFYYYSKMDNFEYYNEDQETNSLDDSSDANDLLF